MLVAVYYSTFTGSRMIRAAFNGYLPDQYQLIKELMQTDEIVFDRNVPQDAYSNPGGGGHPFIQNIAYLVITFCGVGAVLTLKSFLQSLGSELGKKTAAKVIERFSKDSSKPVDPVGILVEVKPRVVARICMPKLEGPGYLNRMDIPGLIELRTQEIEDGSSAFFNIRFDEQSGLWKAHEVTSGLLVYYDAKGEDQRALDSELEKLLTRNQRLTKQTPE